MLDTNQPNRQHSKLNGCQYLWVKIFEIAYNEHLKNRYKKILHKNCWPDLEERGRNLC